MLLAEDQFIWVAFWAGGNFCKEEFFKREGRGIFWVGQVGSNNYPIPLNFLITQYTRQHHQLLSILNIRIRLNVMYKPAQIQISFEPTHIS